MIHDVLTDEVTGEPITVEFFGLNGEPISISKWVKLFQASDGLKDEISGITIRTVWVGVDVPEPTDLTSDFSYKRWIPGDPPKIYKTLVFDEDGVLIKSRLYSNKQEAIEGHEEFKERYKEIE